MKIAIVTDDGTTVSKHFGRAKNFLVITIDNGIVIDRSMREKMNHDHFTHGEHQEHGHGEDGTSESSHQKHTGMVQIISDCEVLISGGMGRGAYMSLQQLNIRPIVTDLDEINQVITKFISGKLIDNPELLH
jgi:predicted Fe-Mo cluster-binding NifX family protein